MTISLSSTRISATRISAISLSLALFFGIPAVAQSQSLTELIRQAHTAQVEGNDAIAQTLWQNVIQIDANNLAAYNNLAISLANQGQMSAALDALNAAMEIDPDYAFAAYNLSLVFYNIGRFDDADTLLQSIAAPESSTTESSTTTDDYHHLGVALYDDGSRSFTETAQSAEQSAAQSNAQPTDDSAFAYINLGAALYRQEQFAASEAAFRLASQVDASHLVAFEGLGHALHAQGKYDAATAAYRQILNVENRYHIDPTVTRKNLGYALARQGRHEEAIIAFQQAIQVTTAVAEVRATPFNADLHEQLGEVLFRTGRYTEAEAALREAIALWIEDGSSVGNGAYASLGSLMMLTGELEAAETVFREWLSRDADIEAYARLGHLLALQARYDEAEIEIEKGLSSYPQYVETLQNSPRSYSLELYKRDYALAYRVLGAIRLEQRQVKESIEALQASVALFPGDTLTHYYLGQAFLSQGELAAATSAFQTAVDLDPENQNARVALESINQSR